MRFSKYNRSMARSAGGRESNPSMSMVDWFKKLLGDKYANGCESAQYLAAQRRGGLLAIQRPS
jgi:hypothetical protein